MSQNRGRVEHEHHQRKVDCICVSALVRAVFSAQAAIDRVHRLNAPVTRIINQLKQDCQTGNLHQLLQIISVL
jgi:hypothetical protein